MFFSFVLFCSLPNLLTCLTRYFLIFPSIYINRIKLNLTCNPYSRIMKSNMLISNKQVYFDIVHYECYNMETIRNIEIDCSS